MYVLVLGIDPGMAIMGYGLASQVPGGRPQALTHGVIRAGGLAPERQLLRLFGTLRELLAAHRPDAVAVERLYFTRNAQTAIGVGQARGVALLAVAEAGLPVREFTPTAVKMAVTGYGGAGKAQVQAMVAALLGLASPPRPDDAADALAVALCCLQGEGLARRVDAATAARPRRGDPPGGAAPSGSRPASGPPRPPRAAR